MQQPCISDLPTEIISQILLAAVEIYNNEFGMIYKWRSPLLFRRISKRFYHITSGTRSLWKYLYLRQPIHPYLQDYISHSGSLPLSINILYDAGKGDESQTWKEIKRILVPLFPRISSLTFHTPSTNDPIFDLLQNEMPILDSLIIKGTPVCSEDNPEIEPNLPLSHLTSLRYLKVNDFPHCANGGNLPETLEELHLDIGGGGSTHHSGCFWCFLPSKLRVLRTSGASWEGVAPDHQKRVHFPGLTELHFWESFDFYELSILQFLDAPYLQSLEVVLGYEDNIIIDDSDAPWLLDFPALTHLTWRSLPRVPRFDDFLRQCSSLTTLRFDTRERSGLIVDFVVALVDDPNLLPRLADLMVPGVSILTLKKAVQVRPQLKRLEVYEADLDVDKTASVEKHAEWQECRNWLESHVNFHVSSQGGRYINNHFGYLPEPMDFDSLFPR